ncbi:MAG: DUF4080 domain-containing protein [Spirochaetaceae bacterium]|nr:DUF4080 domain-containing protein [Spirochaetaceae bacterium]MBQ4555350.1 DUF4080 domain-containing protein [Spirochaetaceae bacterium]
MKEKIVCATLLVEKSPQALPLGAACVASSIKSRFKNLEVLLFSPTMEDSEYFGKSDVKKANIFAENLLEFAGVDAENSIKAVCLSVYVWNRLVLEKVGLSLMEKGILVIAGGPEITANPDSFVGADFVVSGEGEAAVPLLLEKLEKSSKSGIDDTSIFEKDFAEEAFFVEKSKYHPETKKVFYKKSLAGEDLTSPYLDGTLDLSKYEGALWELARGCPFKCSYCYESKGEKKVRLLPMERIEKELKLFAEKDVPQVFVLDPTYNANKERALSLLKMMAKITSNTFYYFEARAEFIDRQIAKAFTKLPCAVQFGLQSSDEEVLKKVNRSFNKAQFVKNINILNQEGVIFGFDLIYGLPGDNLSGFCNSIDFALNLMPNNLELFCLSVLRGTDLFDDAKGYGLVFQEEAPYHVIETPGFSKDDMKKAAKVSAACNVFYNKGRAVPWFASLMKALQIKPSKFFKDFIAWYESKKCNFAPKNEKKLSIEELSLACVSHKEVEKLQLDFLRDYLDGGFSSGNSSVKSSGKTGKKQYLLPTVENLIRFNGAISRVTADGTKEKLSLAFHPDDLASPYAADMVFFAKNCSRFGCEVAIEMGSQGIWWQVKEKGKR